MRCVDSNVRDVAAQMAAVLIAVDVVYVAAGGSLSVRAILAFLLLLPPAALMGTTLPIASRALSRDRSAGSVAGALYGVNTAGAVCGALAAGCRVEGAVDDGGATPT